MYNTDFFYPGDPPSGGEGGDPPPIRGFTRVTPPVTPHPRVTPLDLDFRGVTPLIRWSQGPKYECGGAAGENFAYLSVYKYSKPIWGIGKHDFGWFLTRKSAKISRRAFGPLDFTRVTPPRGWPPQISNLPGCLPPPGVSGSTVEENVVFQASKPRCSAEHLDGVFNNFNTVLETLNVGFCEIFIFFHEFRRFLTRGYISRCFWISYAVQEIHTTWFDWIRLDPIIPCESTGLQL